MNSFLLFLIFCMLVSINDKLNKLVAKGKEEKIEDNDKKSLKELIPTYTGKYCEISLNKFLTSFDHLYNGMMKITATIIDFDDEWIILETFKKDKKYRHIIRISLITDIIEIQD